MILKSIGEMCLDKILLKEQKELLLSGIEKIKLLKEKEG